MSNFVEVSDPSTLVNAMHDSPHISFSFSEVTTSFGVYYNTDMNLSDSYFEVVVFFPFLIFLVLSSIWFFYTSGLLCGARTCGESLHNCIINSSPSSN